MRLVSQPDLVELTGKAWRTVVKRLKDAGVVPKKRIANGDMYASDEALEKIYGVLDQASELEQARTRLAREQADRLAYENAVSAGELGNVVELASMYAGAVSNVVTKLNAIPDAVAQRFDVNTAPKVRAAVREFLDAAITDLRADSERAARGARGSVAHATGSNGESVGRRASKAVERGKRRARAMAN